MKVGTQIPSSTGGTITFTKTGLIHNSGKAYGGRQSADMDDIDDDLLPKNKKKSQEKPV